MLKYIVQTARVSKHMCLWAFFPHLQTMSNFVTVSVYFLYCKEIVFCNYDIVLIYCLISDFTKSDQPKQIFSFTFSNKCISARICMNIRLIHVNKFDASLYREHSIFSSHHLHISPLFHWQTKTAKMWPMRTDVRAQSPVKLDITRKIGFL